MKRSSYDTGMHIVVSLMNIFNPCHDKSHQIRRVPENHSWISAYDGHKVERILLSSFKTKKEIFHKVPTVVRTPDPAICNRMLYHLTIETMPAKVVDRWLEYRIQQTVLRLAGPLPNNHCDPHYADRFSTIVILLVILSFRT